MQIQRQTVTGAHGAPSSRRSAQVIMMVLFVILQFLVVAAAFLGGYIVREWRISGFPGSGQDFPVFHEALELLRDNAVFDLPDGKAMEYGMIRGMLTAVNEPYTVFVEPPQHELQSDQLQGKYGGIGVRIERDANNRVTLFPYPDSPAFKAGIREGDRLLEVDNLKVTPETPDQDLNAAIRGPVGEKVKVIVGSAPDFSPREYSIERAEVALPSTTWNIATDEPRVGIVHIHVIASTTPDEVARAVKDLQDRGAERFVIDVRNNGGGLVEAGVNTARLFLKNGTVIQQQYRGQPVKTFSVEKEGALANLPIVILANQGTASAAEIFAGALKGQKRALIVGTRTYGKDTIQLVFSLSDGSSLHVTAAHWWVPGLEPKIGGKGIQPDVPVEETAPQNAALLKAVETVMK